MRKNPLFVITQLFQSVLNSITSIMDIGYTFGNNIMLCRYYYEILRCVLRNISILALHARYWTYLAKLIDFQSKLYNILSL